ncbi:MAG: DNA methylase, partial [Cellulosilyticum sp.]|nr:DNA methylase [Cellulosilyticum sp.]
IDAGEFYRGLDERYIKRDDMYFLTDQVRKYDEVRTENELMVQLTYIITSEKDALGFLMQELSVPQTYQDIQPKFVKILRQIKYEDMPELTDLLEENFLQDEEGKWYIPDITKQGDIEKLREKKLLKQFNTYLEGKGKLKTARIEAIQAGFKKAWKEKNFETIVKVGNRLPDSIILEDQKLFMYYDNAKLQVEE